LTIFGVKIGVFLKNQCYEENFAQFSFIFSQKRHFFAEFFDENIFKNHNIGPTARGPCAEAEKAAAVLRKAGLTENLHVLASVKARVLAETRPPPEPRV
jgi:hypothetical protein